MEIMTEDLKLRCMWIVELLPKLSKKSHGFELPLTSFNRVQKSALFNVGHPALKIVHYCQKMMGGVVPETSMNSQLFL